MIRNAPGCWTMLDRPFVILIELHGTSRKQHAYFVHLKDRIKDRMSWFTPKKPLCFVFYAVYVAYELLKSADLVFWLCFPADKIPCGKQSRIQPCQEMCRSAKEYRNVWFFIHYLDFHFVIRYYVCSLQLEIVNEVCRRVFFLLLICQ